MFMASKDRSMVQGAGEMEDKGRDRHSVEQFKYKGDKEENQG